MANGERRAALAASLIRFLARAPAPNVRVPQPFIGSMFGVRRYGARLRRRVAKVGQFEIPYLEGGEGDTLVLLHGFADTKDAFVDIAAHLRRHYRVILPDLPGFSEASRPEDFRYSLPNMTDVFGEFCRTLGLNSFHIGGNSLGGAVSVKYALQNPSAVRSLMLLNAAGVEPPTPSELQQRVDAGENPWAIETFEEHDAFMRLMLEQMPPIPGPVRRHLADDLIARGPAHTKMLDDLLEDQLDLTDELPQIRVPTLTLWGDRDRVIDISAGRVFHRQIPDARLVILHGIGHCPQHEDPDRTASVMLEFLRAAAVA